MQRNFTRRLQFTKLLKAHGRLREFNFLKHNKGEDDFFSVDTVDDRGNRIIYTMRNRNNGWKIQENPGLPVWVLETEEQLHQVIEEETN
jgi:hypothetical protein